VFPLSNWTELDIWQYILAEQHPIVPLYFAAERPGGERAGTWIMVDDDRLPLAPGETPQMRKVRFRTLGCYPLTGAVESEPRPGGEIIAEMLRRRTSERQGRLIDRRGLRLDGEEEAGGLFLMTPPPARASDIAAISPTRPRRCASHLRQRRRRQEHADRPPAVRQPAASSRTSSPPRADSRKHGTQGEAIDLALLVDGLEAEREQGITIDVAYRFFATDRRKPSSSPTRRATSSTRATWRPAPPMPSSPSS
jgi:hypothetical protein